MCVLVTYRLLTFISLTYWNVRQSMTRTVMSVVPARRVVDGEGLGASVFTGAGRLLSGQPRSEPMNGSQQLTVPSHVTAYRRDSRKVSERIDFLWPVYVY